MEKIIIKKNGEREKFNEEKFCNNLINLGLDKEAASKICKKIYEKIPSEISSFQLFKITLNELKKENIGLALKYNLREAIYKLGPTGFPFEKYFGKILAHYGYETFANFWVDGACLNYEIDILAMKDKEKFIIECKYHRDRNIKTDLKTVLYVFGRWVDINEKFPELKPWLVTNTKITSEGIEFANCKKIKITAWKFPENESLEKLIEAKALYPITILIRTPFNIIRKLIENNFVLIQDFNFYSLEDIHKRTNIDLQVLKKIKSEIDALLEFNENLVSSG